MAKILLRRKQVQERVNLSRSELYRLIGLGRFPRPVPLGERVRAWDADEIEAWIAARIAARDDAKAE
jgi:prophage regulatory protein